MMKWPKNPHTGSHGVYWEQAAATESETEASRKWIANRMVLWMRENAPAQSVDDMRQELADVHEMLANKQREYEQLLTEAAQSELRLEREQQQVEMLQAELRRALAAEKAALASAARSVKSDEPVHTTSERVEYAANPVSAEAPAAVVEKANSDPFGWLAELVESRGYWRLEGEHNHLQRLKWLLQQLRKLQLVQSRYAPGSKLSYYAERNLRAELQDLAKEARGFLDAAPCAGRCCEYRAQVQELLDYAEREQRSLS